MELALVHSHNEVDKGSKEVEVVVEAEEVGLLTFLL